MKERILFLIFAVSSILVGCTNDGTTDGPVMERPSDMPIVLNAKGTFDAMASAKQSAPATRASVDDISQLGKVGIFMLAGEETGINGSDLAQAPDWSVVIDPANYATTTNGTYWSNLKCTVDPVTGRLSVDSGQDYIWYYPITSWYAYDFYGYYPYQNDYTVTKNNGKSQVTVDFKIDGTQDVLWGRSEIKDDKYAYSARYFRNSTDSVVKMNFKHKLAQFQFYIVPQKKNESTESTFNGIRNLSVKQVTMHRVATNLRMTVAESDNRRAEDCVVEPVPNDAQLENVILKDRDGMPISDNPIPFQTKMENGEEVADTVRIGDCIMVCPDEKAYYMSMVICKTDEHTAEYKSEKEMTIKLSTGGFFEDGKIYKIYIKASGVTEIALGDATVEDWVEAPDDDNLDFDID